MAVKRKHSGIRLNHILSVIFIILSFALVGLGAVFLYRMYSLRMESQIIEELESDTRQINNQLTSWMQNMITVANTAYYDIVADVELQDHDLTMGFKLLYNSNEAYIENISLFTEDGELLLSVPDAELKEPSGVTGQDWFSDTISQNGNIIFSLPHVQNLFSGDFGEYTWTLPMCRSVTLTLGNTQVKGILRFDLKYTSLEKMMENAIPDQSGSVYLTDSEGNLVYHSQRWLLTDEQKDECRDTALSGSGQRREGSSYISVQDIGYTGWIIVNTREAEIMPVSKGRTLAFYLMFFMIFITIVVLINIFFSSLVARPFQKLEAAVSQIQDGNMDITVESTGIYEADSLGNAIVSMAGQIKKLIQNIREEQETKRRMEMDALQAQINPHFLYNTLDVIVWLIENGKPHDAAKGVVMLAKFFRISLSKGQNVIPVRDEIEHTKSYLTIQSLRYRNRFTWHVDMDEDAGNLMCVKLILQPLVENAINHGIVHIEDEGEIWVSAFTRENELLLIVKDNGCGMMEGTVEKLLSGEIEASSGHSGIGVKNVNQRIKLYYGEDYGLEIMSEFDEGTEIIVHLPIISNNKEGSNEKA